MSLPASPENSGVPSGRRLEAGAQQCSLALYFSRIVHRQQKYIFCLNSPQGWRNQGAWEDVALKKHPFQSCCSDWVCRSESNTVRRGLNKRQRAAGALLDLSSLEEIPAHKKGFSRAGYPFHRRVNSPFQQRSNSKKEIRIEIFHVNQGEKEPRSTSCYELRMSYISVLLLTARYAQGVDLSLPSSTNS